MRILLISARADHGGGPQNLFQHAEILSREHEVFVACPREEPYWPRCERLLGAARLLEIPHRAFHPGTLRAIGGLLRREKIEVVHSHGFGAGVYSRLAALLYGVPCVHTPHGLTPARSASGRVKFAVDWLLSLATARLIGTSASEAEEIRARAADAAKVGLILNGVRIPPEPLPASVFEEKPLRVLHVTRFVYQKNPELFLDVLDRVRAAGGLEGFRFVVLGDGEGRAAFEAEAARRGLAAHVECPGALNAMGAEYARGFCLLSTSRWEGMPIAMLEAQAYGLPVIATDVVGNRDAVAPETSGVLFDPAQPEVAAQALLALAASRERWLTLRDGARRRTVELFSEERMVAETLATYRAALGRRAPAPSSRP